MLWSIDSCQNKKTRYPLTSITWPYRGLSCRPIEVKYFLKLSADKVLIFKWSQAQVLIFLILVKYVVFMCCTIKILISNWPRRQKFSRLLQAGKTVAFDFSHHVRHHVHALVTLYVQFLCSDWSKFDRWVHAESCLLWQLKLTEFCVNFWCFNCLFPLDVQNEIQLLSGVICYSWLVCIGFRMASFSFSPCLMRKRVAKSEPILALLDTFQELHLEW